MVLKKMREFYVEWEYVENANRNKNVDSVCTYSASNNKNYLN